MSLHPETKQILIGSSLILIFALYASDERRLV